MQFQGFFYLHARILLEKQFQLGKLEKDLDFIDQEDNGSEIGQFRLNNRRYDCKHERPDPFRSRTDILSDIHDQLKSYDDMLLKARDVLALQKPSSRDYRNVKTYFYNLKPLSTDECAFIRKKEDIISLRSGREWCEFDIFIERLLHGIDFFGILKVRTSALTSKYVVDREIAMVPNKRASV